MKRRGRFKEGAVQANGEAENQKMTAEQKGAAKREAESRPKKREK